MSSIENQEVFCHKCKEELALKEEGGLIYVTPCHSCAEYCYQMGYSEGQKRERDDHKRDETCLWPTGSF